jgi:PAS domain S-box-containing protein
MKQKSISPNSVERQLSESEFIVSKTDVNGRITYANRIFMQISQYPETNLLNVQHNIVRHPEMPRGVYRLMWRTIKSGQEFFGFVKNLAQDGSFYWVFASVTPDYLEDGTMKGYFSVRRKASVKGVETVTPIYRKMLEIEQDAGKRDAPDRSLAYLLEQVEELGMEYNAFAMALQNDAPIGKLNGGSAQ